MSSSMHLMISVIIPTLNEERYIEACLASVINQTYPRDRIEILVVDGGSTDGTRELVLSAIGREARIALLDNPDRIQSAGFNRAITHSLGDVIALVSAHSTLDPTYLVECVAELTRSGADNVGGRMVARGSGAFQEAVAAAMSSPVGVGGARQHYAASARDVDSVWPGCFRRELFDRIGSFRADLAVHEDYELNHRIRRAGGRVRFSPAISATYYVRSSVRTLAHQYVRYGRAKAGVARAEPDVLRAYHLVPPALVAGLALTLAVAPMSPRARRVGATVFTTYGATLIGSAGIAGRGHRAAVQCTLPVVLAVMHLSWGAGMWAGLLAGPPGAPRRSAQRPLIEVTASRVRAMMSASSDADWRLM